MARRAMPLYVMANPIHDTQTFAFQVQVLGAHNGVHENYVMSRRLVPQTFCMYVMLLGTISKPQLLGWKH